MSRSLSRPASAMFCVRIDSVSSRHRARGEAGCSLQRAEDPFDEPRIAELARREVHADVQLRCFRHLVTPDRELPARLVEHPPSELGDEAHVLGDGDELRRRDPSEQRVRPAHQRFDAERLPVGQGDDRLEVHFELAALGAPRRLCSSSSRSAARARIDWSNTAMPSRPASFAWYIAVSASRIIVSKSTAGSLPSAKATPRLADE